MLVLKLVAYRKVLSNLRNYYRAGTEKNYPA